MLVAALAGPALGVQAYDVAVSISRDGPRPAAGRLERRAHTRMARRWLEKRTFALALRVVRRALRHR